MKSFLPLIELVQDAETIKLEGELYLHTFEVGNIADRTAVICIGYKKASDTEVYIKFTASVCNPEDQYRQSLGREIAIGRAIAGGHEGSVNVVVNRPRDLISQVRSATRTLIHDNLVNLESCLLANDQHEDMIRGFQDQINEDISEICK